MDRDAFMLHMVMLAVMVCAECDAGLCTVEHLWILAAITAMMWSCFFVEIWRDQLKYHTNAETTMTALNIAARHSHDRSRPPD